MALEARTATSTHAATHGASSVLGIQEHDKPSTSTPLAPVCLDPSFGYSLSSSRRRYHHAFSCLPLENKNYWRHGGPSSRRSGPKSLPPSIESPSMARTDTKTRSASIKATDRRVARLVHRQEPWFLTGCALHDTIFSVDDEERDKRDLWRGHQLLSHHFCRQSDGERRLLDRHGLTDQRRHSRQQKAESY